MTSSNKIKIGQYNVLQTLGVGSFGKVKLAVHSVTGHKVALKIINRKKIANLDMAGRVKREIQYLKLLRHPHIIKLYEVITTPTDIIMVMEYAGGELFNYIVENGRMNEDDARRFFQQIIGAVEYCHRHKIVHRDLKPENLLLDPYQNVKIADFGLSNIMTDGDFLKTSCGSPNYAAPEVISGKLYAGPEVDVWSCGVILYVMLCGRLPFDDEYIPSLFKKINGGIYTLPSFLSPETKYLLSSMLVVNPLKRISIQEIRQNPWFNVGLPDYLKPLPDTIVEGVGEVDQGIVEELNKKMGFSHATILKALSEPENNQIKVSYQLVVDHQRMLNNAKASTQNNITSFFATSPPPWNSAFPDEDGDTDKSSIEILGSSIPESRDSSRDRPSQMPSMIPPTFPGSVNTSAQLPKRDTMKQRPPSSPSSVHHHRSQPIDKSKKPRSKWHFGIRSKCPPWEVMLEIYRALKGVGVEWKTLDPYHLRCRYVYPRGLIVKIDLQLYKLDSNSYLVDFKNVGCTLNSSTPMPNSENFPTPSSSISSVKTPLYVAPHSFSSASHSRGSSISDSSMASGSDLEDDIDRRQASVKGVQTRQVVEEITMSGRSPPRVTANMGGDKEMVMTVFPFFDVCCKLITELAISG